MKKHQLEDLKGRLTRLANRNTDYYIRQEAYTRIGKIQLELDTIYKKEAEEYVDKYLEEYK